MLYEVSEKSIKRPTSLNCQSFKDTFPQAFSNPFHCLGFAVWAVHFFKKKCLEGENMHNPMSQLLSHKMDHISGIQSVFLLYDLFKCRNQMQIFCVFTAELLNYCASSYLPAVEKSISLYCKCILRMWTIIVSHVNKHKHHFDEL